MTYHALTEQSWLKPSATILPTWPILDAAEVSIPGAGARAVRDYRRPVAQLLRGTFAKRNHGLQHGIY